MIVSDNLSYVPIVLREYEDPTKVVGVIAVGSTEVVEMGRGLLGMLSQTLKVLVAAGLPPPEGGTVEGS